MLISPDSFIEGLKYADYYDLLRERDKLIRSIRRFEKKQKSGDNEAAGIYICPSPDVVYQCELQYLSRLCELIADRFRDYPSPSPEK